MGKGDRKTKKGKIYRGSYGNTRRKNRKRKKSIGVPELKSNENPSQLERLYVLHELYTSNLNALKESIQEADQISNSSQKSLGDYKKQIKSIRSRIQDITNKRIQFSIEELYNQFGRYDKFVKIDFHLESKSKNEFGRSIMGTLVYNRREREDIRERLKLKNVPRTNDFVKIDCSKLSTLDLHKKEILKERGFLSGDVFKVSFFSENDNDAYEQDSIKEHPGTIKINFDFDDAYYEQFVLFNFEQRIAEDLKPLIESEWDKYVAYKLLTEGPDNLSETLLQRLFEPKDKKKLKNSVKYHIYVSKVRRKQKLHKDEIVEFKKLIKKRRRETAKRVERELNRSTNKKLNVIISENERLVTELKEIAFKYEELNLSPIKAKHSVYLDLDRYLHIYLRHFSDFQIENWEEKKTSFQYTFEDTNRLLRTVIERIQEHIDSKLEKGKEFRIYDKKAHYYNGNYYFVHIDNNGRLLSFFPYRNL